MTPETYSIAQKAEKINALPLMHQSCHIRATGRNFIGLYIITLHVSTPMFSKHVTFLKKKKKKVIVAH